MKAVFKGKTLAESGETVVVGGYHYFPPESVNWGQLSKARAKSVCLWKGIASYFDIKDSGTKGKMAAWSYRRPYPWIRKIRGHVAFWGPVEIRS